MRLLLFTLALLSTLVTCPGRGEEPLPPKSDPAVALNRALAWLIRHQSMDGHWDAVDYTGRCKKPPCTGTGDKEENVRVTSLALLAISSGPPQHEKTLKDTADRAFAWLRKQQNDDGCIGSRKSNGDYIYFHAVATLALCDAIAKGEASLKEPAQKAVDYLLQCQNPSMGWRYKNYNLKGSLDEKDGSNNDTLVTGWVVQALDAARRAKLKVPDTAFEGASAFLDTVYNKGSFGFTKAGNCICICPYVTTAMGVLAREILGQEKDVKACLPAILAGLPRWKKGDNNFYAWHLGTLALAGVGGEAWEKWEEPLVENLVAHQETEGCKLGSWDPAEEDPFGHPGGRACTTALAALCLEEAAKDLKK